MRWMCLLPALLLSMLFYLDQNITVRTTEAALNLKATLLKGGDKGILSPGYACACPHHGRFECRGAAMGVRSHGTELEPRAGMQWQLVDGEAEMPMVAGEILEEDENQPIGGVVKSTQILGEEDGKESAGSGGLSKSQENGKGINRYGIGNGGGEVRSTHPLILERCKRVMRVVEERKFMNIMETRVTGFTIHAMILSSLMLLPLLSFIPIPVISGIFLYLGIKIMKGNLFFERLGDILLEDPKFKSLPQYRNLNRGTLARYLQHAELKLCTDSYMGAQVQSEVLYLSFSACIGILAFMRVFLTAAVHIANSNFWTLCESLVCLSIRCCVGAQSIVYTLHLERYFPK